MRLLNRLLIDPGIAIDMPLDKALGEAHAIVVGTVTESTVRFAPSDPPPDRFGFKKIVTEYTVDVREVVKETPGKVAAPLRSGCRAVVLLGAVRCRTVSRCCGQVARTC